MPRARTASSPSGAWSGASCETASVPRSHSHRDARGPPAVAAGVGDGRCRLFRHAARRPADPVRPRRLAGACQDRDRRARLVRIRPESGRRRLGHGAVCHRGSIPGRPDRQRRSRFASADRRPRLPDRRLRLGARRAAVACHALPRGRDVGSTGQPGLFRVARDAGLARFQLLERGLQRAAVRRRPRRVPHRGCRDSCRDSGSRARRREDILSFGLGIYVKNLLEYCTQNIDNLIVGRVLGMTSLGYYDKAFNTVTKLSERISLGGPGVSLTAFALMQDDLPRFRRAYRKVILSVSLVGYPVLAGMAVVADELVEVMFGSRWQPAALPLQILCVAAMLRQVSFYASSATQAQGYIWSEVKRQALAVVLAVVGVAWLSRWGIAGAAVGVLLSVVSPTSCSSCWCAG